MQGLVVKNTGSWYTVLADDGRRYEAKARGKLRLRGLRTTNPVAIGDRVEFTPTDDAAFITAIQDRKNYVIRRATNLSKQSHIIAANVDQCLLIVTLTQPETSTTFIDRFLASAEAYRIPVVIVFNKTDLLTEPDRQVWLRALTDLYRRIGYTVLHTSALTGQGMEALGQTLGGKVTLLSGNSGVGKSSLINYLFPSLHLRTGEVSEAYQTGRHTTTFSQMFPLPHSGEGSPPKRGEPEGTEGSRQGTLSPIEESRQGAGFLIDTPGIKGFGTFDMEPQEVGHYFRELFAASAHCRFRGCTHTHEPGCAVREAIDNGTIALSRYNSYLSMLNDKDEDRYRPCY